MTNKIHQPLGQATQSPEPIPPPARYRGHSSRGGSSSRFWGARPSHGVSCGSISDTNTGLAGGRFSWGHSPGINRGMTARWPV